MEMRIQERASERNEKKKQRLIFLVSYISDTELSFGF